MLRKTISIFVAWEQILAFKICGQRLKDMGKTLHMSRMEKCQEQVFNGTLK